MNDDLIKGLADKDDEARGFFLPSFLTGFRETVGR